MSLWWALPVFVLVGGASLAALLLDRLGRELAALDEALRRSGRMAVQTGDLGRDMGRLHATADRLAVRGQDLTGPSRPRR